MGPTRKACPSGNQSDHNDKHPRRYCDHETEVAMLCEELERLEGEFDEIVTKLEDPNLTDEQRDVLEKSLPSVKPYHQGSSNDWTRRRALLRRMSKVLSRHCPISEFSGARHLSRPRTVRTGQCA